MNKTQTIHYNLKADGTIDNPLFEQTGPTESQANQVEFVMVDGELQVMTPFNTLITYYKPDYTVDRKKTIRSFSQYYSRQIPKLVNQKLLCYSDAIMSNIERITITTATRTGGVAAMKRSLTTQISKR